MNLSIRGTGKLIRFPNSLFDTTIVYCLDEHGYFCVFNYGNTGKNKIIGMTPGEQGIDTLDGVMHTIPMTIVRKEMNRKCRFQIVSKFFEFLTKID